MTTSIRALQGQEMLDALYALNQYSLHASPPFGDKEEWDAVVRQRQGVSCHAMFEGDQPISIAAATAMTQNLRGALFPAAGVWGVSTQPQVRRQGTCRQVIASLLKSARENQKAFTNLYPFSESFYERMGYVAFPLTKIVRFAPAALQPLLKLETGGAIELHLIGDGFDAYREYLTAMRLTCHGMGFFDVGDRAAANRNRQWMALAKFGDQVEGLMLYSNQGDEPTRFKFFATRFYYQTSRARYLLLNWIARHIDQCDRAEIWLPAGEYPETWQADLQIQIEAPPRPAMCRVLDVEKIGGMNVGPGSFSAQISDPLCPWNEGTWLFEAHLGSLRVSRTSQPDCRLTIQGLSALISGTHDPQDFSLRDWGDPTPELQVLLRQMFPRLLPFMHEYF
ncbi:MAG: GNAT family N-acetyltransferase [Anaerolineae bacterium]|nr:GNAT family N-acetyltransferase [Anaerolineae bacterium]